MVLYSGSSGSKSSPGSGHCVVFLGKTLYPHSASLHQGVQRAGGNLLKKLDEMLWGIKRTIDGLHPSRGLGIVLVA